MINKRYSLISISLLSLFSSCSTSLKPTSPSLDQVQVDTLPGPTCSTSLQSTSPSSGQIQVASPPPAPTHFFLSVDKSTLVIEQGSFAAVDVAAVDAYSNLVLREVSGGGRPSGMSINPKLPLTLYGGEGSFNVNVDSTVAPGKYSFSVRATLPGKTTPVTNAVKIEVEVLRKKYDWIRQFGTSGFDSIHSLAVDPSGNIYMAGFANSPDGYLVKYDSTGTELWAKRSVSPLGFGFGEAYHEITTDRTGYVYVVGQYLPYLPGGPSAYMKKYDSCGNELWGTQFGTAEWDSVHNSVATDASGNIYVAGSTKGTLPGQVNLGKGDVYLMKYDSDGKEIWNKEFGTTEWDTAASVATDPSGNIYVAGYTEKALPGQVNLGKDDAFIRKYDSLGNELWTQQFGSNEEDMAASVATDASGNVYVAGNTGGTLPGQVNLGRKDFFIRKYDSSGNALWTQQFGTTEWDATISVTTDVKGNVYVAGSTGGTLPGQVNLGQDDVFIRKYDSNGVELSTKQFGTDDFDRASSVATDASGNVYVAGDTKGTLPGQVNLGELDAFLYKFAP